MQEISKQLIITSKMNSNSHGSNHTHSSGDKQNFMKRFYLWNECEYVFLTTRCVY